MNIQLKLARILILYITLSGTYECLAQSENHFDVTGKWKVKKWYFFERVHETPSEHNEKMREVKKCLASQFVISSKGIKNTKNTCDFYPCTTDFLSNPSITIKKIVPDDNNSFDAPGSEMIDSDIVTKKFIKYLDKNYSKKTLKLLDSKCKQSYGNYTMKICLVNKNVIGFFFGEELIVLERVKFDKDNKRSD